MPSQLNYSGLLEWMGPPIQTVFPLFLHLPQLWSAGQRNCLLWFSQPAVRRDITLHNPPLSGSVWVGVCEYVGRYTPQSWQCSKTSLQHYCHLHNWALLFLISYTFSVLQNLNLFFLSLSQVSTISWLLLLWQRVYLLHLAQLVNTRIERLLQGLHTSLSNKHASNAKAAIALTVTLWFWEIALAHRGKGSAAMKSPPQSVLLKSTTSFVNVANKRWNKESRSTDANNKLTWLWCLECKQPWANVCCFCWTSNWMTCIPEHNSIIMLIWTFIWLTVKNSKANWFT